MDTPQLYDQLLSTKEVRSVIHTSEYLSLYTEASRETRGALLGTDEGKHNVRGIRIGGIKTKGVVHNGNHCDGVTGLVNGVLRKCWFFLDGVMCWSTTARGGCG